MAKTANGHHAHKESRSKPFPELTEDPTKKHYERIQKELEPTRKTLTEIAAPYRTRANRLQSAWRNTGNITRNAYDSIAGTVKAVMENHRTRKALKENPSRTATFVVRGRAQPAGGGYRQGLAEKEEGRLPYHVSIGEPAYRQGIQNAADTLKKKIERAYQRMGFTEAEIKKRKDGALLHSSSADAGKYAVMKKSIPGIKYMVGVAGTYYGQSMKGNLAQKIISGMVDIKQEDPSRSPLARKYAVQMFNAGKLPKNRVRYAAVSGVEDQLARFESGYDPNADTNKMLEKGSTHFATSAADYGMAQRISRILSEQMKYQAHDELKKKREAKYGTHYKRAA